MRPFKQIFCSLVLCWIFLGSSLAGDSGAVTSGTYTYREQTGEEQVDYTWSLKKREDQVVISSIQPTKQFETVCSPHGETYYWSFIGENGEKMTASRSGDTLHLLGTVDGKEIRQEIPLDQRPWFQPLSFSLRTLAGSTKTAMEFWAIRPDTYEVVELTAEKKGCKTVEQETWTDDVCEVQVSKSGWMSSLWHASYWFRKSDGLFVEYRSVHGIPGTPETVIRLLQ